KTEFPRTLPKGVPGVFLETDVVLLLLFRGFFRLYRLFRFGRFRHLWATCASKRIDDRWRGFLHGAGFGRCGLCRFGFLLKPGDFRLGFRYGFRGGCQLSRWIFLRWRGLA